MVMTRSFGKARRLPYSFRVVSPLAPRTYFHSGGVQAVGQESSLNRDDRAAEAEHHKQDQLKTQQEGKGSWTPELASDSESAIKADRAEVDSSPQSIEDLQKQTEGVAAEKHGQK